MKGSKGVGVGVAISVGKLVIHTSLDTRTVNLLANYSKDLTTNQKYAVMDALIIMEESGALAKTKKMYLPLLAGGLDETMINAVDPSYTADAIPSATYWALRNQGLVNSSGSATGGLMVNLSGLGLSSLNFSAFNYNTEVYTAKNDHIHVSSTNTTLNYAWVSNEVVFPGSSVKVGGVSFGVPSVVPTVIYLGAGKGLKGLNFNSTSILQGISGETITDKTYVTAPIAEGVISDTIDLTGFANSRFLKPQGFILFGEGMTEAQLLSINTAVNLITTALGI